MQEEWRRRSGNLIQERREDRKAESENKNQASASQRFKDYVESMQKGEYTMDPKSLSRLTRVQSGGMVEGGIPCHLGTIEKRKTQTMRDAS